MITRTPILAIVFALITLVLASSSRGAIVATGSIVPTGPSGEDTTIDRWYFEVLTPGTITMDIDSWEHDVTAPVGDRWTDLNGDGEAYFFDSVLVLFSDDGDLTPDDYLYSNDDVLPVQGDSVASADAYLSKTLAAGSYVVAVAACCMIASEYSQETYPDSFNFLRSTNGSTVSYTAARGDYELTFTGDLSVVGVPEPSTLTLAALGLLSLGITRRRRQRA
jgi:hypothetical protein